MNDPVPRKRKGKDHWTMTQGARRAVLMLFVAMVVLGASALSLGARTADHLQATVQRLSREVRSQCRFDADLAGVPITVNPATGKASVLGVKIVSDSRVAWRVAGCPGRLAPPSPSFARWARYYHLPAS